MRAVMVVLAILLLLAGVPLLGWMATFPYQLVDFAGGALGIGRWPDTRKAFAVGMGAGLCMTVARLLYLAARERASRYLLAAVATTLVGGLILSWSAPAESPAPMLRGAGGTPYVTGDPSLHDQLGPNGQRFDEIALDAARLRTVEVRRNLRAREASRQARRQFRVPDAWPGQGDGPVHVDGLTPSADVAAPLSGDEVASLRNDVHLLRRDRGQRSEGVLFRLEAKLESALSRAPRDPQLWKLLAAIYADRDAELAYGALIISHMFETEEPFERSMSAHDAAELSLSLQEIHRTGARMAILKARAKAAAHGRDALSASEAREAERPLPPCASCRAALPPPRDAWPSARDSPNRRVRILADGLAVHLEMSPLDPVHAGHVRVHVDTVPWDHAHSATEIVSLALLELSSGDRALDETVLSAARHWVFSSSGTDPQAGSGRRRRIDVRILPVATSTGPAIVRADQGAAGGTIEGRRLLRELVVDQSRLHPPPYPVTALRERLSGNVMVEIEIDGLGVIHHVDIITSSGHGVLDRAAVEAVRRWDVRPGLATSDVDRMRMRIPFTFVTQ